MMIQETVGANSFNKWIYFSNVDVLTSDKIEELRGRIRMSEVVPKIIVLQEVKPKNVRYQRFLEEYKLDGYTCIQRNFYSEEGRGIFMYIKENVLYSEVEFQTRYCEYLAIKITGKGKSLLFVSIYRSPSSSRENCEALLRLMEEINPVRVDHKIVTGDFNFPEVNWQNYMTTESENSISFRFIEKIRDGFLHQHVMEATRFRGNSATNTLDLIFTSDDSIIDNIRIDAHFGKSDHACVCFGYDLEETCTNSAKSVPLYNKGNYDEVRRLLRIDWTSELGRRDRIHNKWFFFKDKVKQAADECVPRTRSNAGANNTKRNRTNEHLPMDKRLWAKIKRKQ